MINPDTTKPNSTNNARFTKLILFEIAALSEISGNKFAISSRDHNIQIIKRNIITGPDDELLLKNPPG